MVASQVRVLARHFLLRFLDNDLISPDSDVHETATLVLTFLAVPGLLGTGLMLLAYANPWVTPYQRMLIALPDKFLYISWSMLVMAAVTLLGWDALSLDARDYAILGVLPIAPRSLLAGKIAALLLFVFTVMLAVNAVPTFLFPVVHLSSINVSLPLPYGIWLMLSHAAACFGAGAFGFVLVLAVRGLAFNLLGPRLFGRLSVPLQAAVGVGLVIAFLSLSASDLANRDRGVYLSPPMWFLGLYETMTSGTMAIASAGHKLRPWQIYREDMARSEYMAYDRAFGDLALIGLIALAATTVLAFGLYFIAHFRHASALRQAAASAPRGRRRIRRALAAVARTLIVRDPLKQATFFFTLQAAARSARHRLYMGGCVAVALMLAYATIMPAIARDGRAAFETLSTRLLSLQFVLVFFVLAGLRVMFTIPAELRANWQFRLTAVGNVRRCFSGVRRALVMVGVACLLLLAPVHAWLLGPRLALTHFAYGLLWSLVLVEALLLRLEKLPFTCSHVSLGSRKLSWPLYVGGFAFFCYWFPAREAAAMRSGSLALAVFAAVILAVLVAIRTRTGRNQTAFVFQETPDSATVTLQL